jgi:hypothetical protein
VPNSSITLKRYYTSFKSLSGVLAGVVAASPYIAKFLPLEVGAYIFPPLGDADAVARLAVVLFALATTFAVFFWAIGSPDSNGKTVAFAFVVGALAFCFYFGLHMAFVRRVDLFSLTTTAYVSVGYERTEFAKTTFASASDEDLLRARGMNDEQVRLLWTKKSLITARLALFIAYCLSVLSLIAAFSFGVFHETYRAHKS